MKNKQESDATVQEVPFDLGHLNINNQTQAQNGKGTLSRPSPPPSPPRRPSPPSSPRRPSPPPNPLVLHLNHQSARPQPSKDETPACYRDGYTGYSTYNATDESGYSRDRNWDLKLSWPNNWQSLTHRSYSIQSKEFGRVKNRKLIAILRRRIVEGKREREKERRRENDKKERARKEEEEKAGELSSDDMRSVDPMDVDPRGSDSSHGSESPDSDNGPPSDDDDPISDWKDIFAMDHNSFSSSLFQK